ncbi:MAG: HEAT repeat domain-containing protein [Acidobacteriales bacterium]|nr:HEAT repeat domain-containing protein [Terriglobales bacterium]
MRWFRGFAPIAFCMLAAAALAYPRPPEGTEDIPKMMESATLVCKGEVTNAPEPLSSPDPPRFKVFATVRMERCFKGNPGERGIKVQMDGAVSGVGPAFVLCTGDYRLFFLKLNPVDSTYALVNQWFGALEVSRELASQSAGNDPMQLLELDLKAGLRDRDPERVLDSIRMLGNMRKLRSTAELKALLPGSDLLVKTYVWQALLRLHDYSALPAIVKFFETQPEMPQELLMPRDRMFYMQDQLVNEIGRISAEALPYLEKFAASDKRRLRAEALQALRQIKSPRSAPVFLRALDDRDSDNGFVAMQALFELAEGCDCDWVPSMEKFHKSPAFYSTKTREWWSAEGQQKMKMLSQK